MLGIATHATLSGMNEDRKRKADEASGQPDTKKAFCAQTSKLYEAVASCNSYEIEKLIKSGIDVNLGKTDANGSHTTPLCLAVNHKNDYLVRKLLEHGAKPDLCQTLPDRSTQSPLYTAIKDCSSNIVESLLKHKADANLGKTDANQSHTTPLCLAVNHKNDYLVRKLLEHGAKDERANLGEAQRRQQEQEKAKAEEARRRQEQEAKARAEETRRAAQQPKKSSFPKEKQDALKTLMLDPTHNYSQEEIRNAWKAMSKKYHPDKCTQNADKETIAAATAKYQAIKAAYDFLTTP